MYKNQKDKAFEVLAEKVLSDGFLLLKKYTLRHQLYAGGWSSPIERELLMRNHVAGVLLFDPSLEQVVMVEQFRVGVMTHSEGPWLLEIVAGIAENDETSEQVARREVGEETGLAVQKLDFIMDYYPSPGGCSESIRLFCARVDAQNAGGIYGLAHESEDIMVKVISIDKVWDLLADGHIVSGPAIISLQWLKLNYAQIRAQYLDEMNE